MLIKRDILEGIRAGVITRQFRRWTRPRVKVGAVLRTAVGLVRITGVEVVEPRALNEADALAAGQAATADLVDAFPDRGGNLYRIGVAYAGPDPREALRDQAVAEDELPELIGRLERFDRTSTHGPWTREALALILAKPGVRAEDLASEMGWEKKPFKISVRKLKGLGLTESLETGYRLSHRGRTLLDRWR
ncbi:MAG: hypothetical protein ACXW15_09945 [Acidimicrobiia bacterium]